MKYQIIEIFNYYNTTNSHPYTYISKNVIGSKRYYVIYCDVEIIPISSVKKLLSYIICLVIIHNSDLVFIF